MKFNKFAPLLFIVTFFTGYLITPTGYYLAEIPPPAKQILPIPLPENEYLPGLKEDVAEVFEIDSEKEFRARNRKFPLKLVEIGEGFHVDEITAKSGETWLGLFGDGASSELKPASLIVKRARDGVLDAEDADEFTGKSVSVATRKTPRFLIKGLKNVPQGPVKTIFSLTREDMAERDTTIRSGFKQEFTIDGKSYSISARNGVDLKGLKTLALMMETGNVSQIIHTVPAYAESYLGSIEWIGDLDRDGKPDLYLDLYIHDNVIDKNLYLSSMAAKGTLVKRAASFFRTGC